MKRGSFQTGEFSDNERLAALAKYQHAFTSNLEPSTAAHPKKNEQGMVTIGWREPDEVEAFLKDAYDYGWVQDFDWMTWSGTEEGTNLRDKETALASASIESLAKLLTARLRLDRFGEGTITGDFRSGLMLRIIQRAAQLLDLSSVPGNRPSAST